jgi:hypothetical protein
MFDHLFNDVKDVLVILVRERQQTTIKTSQNVEKKIFQVGLWTAIYEHAVNYKQVNILKFTFLFYEKMLGINGKMYFIF